MAASESLLALAGENGGILTTAAAKAAGYHGGSLKYLVKRGRLCRAARGGYTLPEAWDDEFVNLQSRYKRGIFSLDTALFLCNLTDRTPHHFHMTFPQGYNLTRPKADGVHCNVASASIYPIGIVELKTPSGILVRSYGAERTLCDILRPRNHTDIQIVTTAFKQYAKQSEKNIPLLSAYAECLHVQEKVRSYLEVLL